MVLSDVIGGLLGQGDAYSRTRSNFVNSQVYTSENWKIYFTAEQCEVYWTHEQISYTSNNSRASSTSFAYYPSTYKPIEWVPSLHYNDTNYILSVAKARYNSDFGPSFDSGIEGNYFRSIWNTR